MIVMSEPENTEESNAVIVEAKIASFKHDLRVMWDEQDNVSIWLDGEQVGRVVRILVGAAIVGDEVVHTKEVTLFGEDHPLAEILRLAGWVVTVQVVDDDGNVVNAG